jgi:hypothetical protein
MKGIETPRARVDAVADAIRAARDRGILVLATSEVNRGFYGRSKPEEQTTAMAAGKESGRIEYAAETLVVLGKQRQRTSSTSRCQRTVASHGSRSGCCSLPSG